MARPYLVVVVVVVVFMFDKIVVYRLLLLVHPFYTEERASLCIMDVFSRVFLEL